MSTPNRSAERVIGLDVGTHRIGVAVSDELRIIASPEGTLHISQKHNEDGIGQVIAEIISLIHRFETRRIVVGLPRNMKGEQGVQATWTTAFVARLRAELVHLDVYISLIDEQLTTAQAARTFQKPRSRSRGAWPTHEASGEQQRQSRSASTRPAREGRESLDARAAALILQGYLDRRRNRHDGLDAPGAET